MQKRAINVVDGEAHSFILIKELFPFHFFFNQENQIIQIGKGLQKILEDSCIGTGLEDLFYFEQPIFLRDLADIPKFKNEIFILRYKNKEELRLRGQMVVLHHRSITLFVGSPVIGDPGMIKTLGLTINDFANFDSLPDYLFALQAQNTSVREATILTEKLNRQKKELALSIEELKSFAHIASHDLKTPIRTIVSFSQLLLKKSFTVLDQECLDFIGYIINAGKRMEQLTNALLNHSTINYKETTYQKVNLNNSFQYAIADLRNQIEEYNAEISFPQLPTISGDSLQLYQLFQNLLSNALKFKKKGPPVIKLAFEEQEKHYYFEFSDNGIGIAPDYYSKIFLIFQRLHTDLEYEGTGIGLYICKKIIDKHQGEIWIKETEGGGTTFCFTIKKDLA